MLLSQNRGDLTEITVGSITIPLTKAWFQAPAGYETKVGKAKLEPGDYVRAGRLYIDIWSGLAQTTAVSRGAFDHVPIIVKEHNNWLVLAWFCDPQRASHTHLYYDEYEKIFYI